MKALVKLSHKKDDLKLMEVPEPFPQAGQVKVKVKKIGICGTDLYGYQAVKPPVILGHEVSGIVVAKGKNVNTIKIGEWVTTETTVSICGKCRFCQSKDYNLCSERKGLGSSANGAFAEYFCIRKESVHKLPENVDFSAGALIEPLACAVHAVVEQADVSSGEIVLVLGPGPFGLLVTLVAKVLGAKVIVCGKDGDEKRLKFAERSGADATINLKDGKVEEKIMELTSNYGADVVFECSGNPLALHLGLRLIRKKGRYVQAGILREPVKMNLEQILFAKEITLLGSHTQKPSSWKRALNLLSEGKINLKALVTDELPLTCWKEGFKKAKERDSIKVLLSPFE